MTVDTLATYDTKSERILKMFPIIDERKQFIGN